LPDYPTAPALYPVSVRRVRVLPPASFRPSLAATPLPSANPPVQPGDPTITACRGLPPLRTMSCLAQASRGIPRGFPLSHHRTYVLRITAVSSVGSAVSVIGQGIAVFNAANACNSSGTEASVPPSLHVPWRITSFTGRQCHFCCSTFVEYPRHTLQQMIRPFSFATRRLLWPLLTSPHPSRDVAAAVVVFATTDGETSQGKTCLFPPALAGFTCARVRIVIGRLRLWPDYPTAPALYPVSVRRVRVLPPASSRCARCARCARCDGAAARRDGAAARRVGQPPFRGGHLSLGRWLFPPR